MTKSEASTRVAGFIGKYTYDEIAKNWILQEQLYIPDF